MTIIFSIPRYFYSLIVRIFLGSDGGSGVLEREFRGILRSVLPAARAALDIRRRALQPEDLSPRAFNVATLVARGVYAAT